jgi:putative PIN family toxin of toxin-antitoxin system
MIRVVLDTNILVSALLQPKGPPAQIFLMAITGGAVQLCVSGEIYAEYEEVIQRPRLKRSRAEIDNALAAIREQGFWVRPFSRVQACADPDDNIFLECAEVSQAHYLVTGNAKDFPANWAGTRVVSARQFLDAISEIQDEPTV